MNAPIPVLSLTGESLPIAVKEVADVIATAIEHAPDGAMYNADVWAAAIESLQPNHLAALLMVPTLLFNAMMFDVEGIRQFGDDFAADPGTVVERQSDATGVEPPSSRHLLDAG